MHQKWEYGAEEGMNRPRIEFFPPNSSHRKYFSIVKFSLNAGQTVFDITEDDSLVTSEGGDALPPDIIQFHLDPGNAKLLLQYLLYAYAGKKVIDGISSISGAVVKSVASEAGKDIYISLKNAVRNIFTAKLNNELTSPKENSSLYVYLRMYFLGTVLTIRYKRQVGKLLYNEETVPLTLEGIDYSAEFIMPRVANHFIPLLDKIITIINREHLYTSLLVRPEYESKKLIAKIDKYLPDDGDVGSIIVVLKEDGQLDFFATLNSSHAFTDQQEKELDLLRKELGVDTPDANEISRYQMMFLF